MYSLLFSALYVNFVFIVPLSDTLHCRRLVGQALVPGQAPAQQQQCLIQFDTRGGTGSSSGVPPLYPDRIVARMTAFSCILYQHLYPVQLRLDGHSCAVNAVADMLRNVYSIF